MPVEMISPDTLHALYEKGNAINLIDVRTPAEFREIHVPFARNVPLDRLNLNELLAPARGEAITLHVICHSGSRAAKASEALADAGHLNVVCIAGGTKAWEAAGFPVVRGKATISLERQVRIVAGTLVLLGTTAGYFIHPVCLGLSVFVGAGVTYAGVTGSCAMGLLLAKMPWNQVDISEAKCVGATDKPTTICSVKPSLRIDQPKIAS